MLCLPESVPGAIAAVEKAIDEKKLSWDDINAEIEKGFACQIPFRVV